MALLRVSSEKERWHNSIPLPISLVKEWQESLLKAGIIQAWKDSRLRHEILRAGRGLDSIFPFPPSAGLT